MHKVTGDRESVLRLLKGTIRQLGEDEPKSRKVGRAALSVKSAARWPSTRDQLIETLKRGYDRAQVRAALFTAAARVGPNERALDSWYAPRDRAIAVFQAAMDEYLDQLSAKGKPATASLRTKAKRAKPPAHSEPTIDAFLAKTGRTRTGKRGAQSRAALEQFDNLDPRWIEVVWEKAKLLFKGKHKFITHSSVTDFRFSLAEESRVAIVGDWGGGNAAAQAVAEQIRGLNPPVDHIIHLGDVYYAGTPKEIRERFLAYWPTSKRPGSSLALNSNHEMYGGGYGYFDITLKQFKQPASYFCLSNKNWRFIGLDTGYVDHDLNKEQVDWLRAQLSPSGPKNVLLTHHQLFSAFEDTNADLLRSRVQPFLDANQIYGWVWGHEHLCVVYKEHWGIKARCLGNGCFPYNPPKDRPKIPVEWMDTRPQPGDNDYRGIHTFCLLEISGSTITLKYIDQDGTVGYQETWA